MSTTALDRWDVRVPDGWGPVAAVCRELFASLDDITELINDRICEELDEFRQPGSVISREDLRWSTGGGVANFLRGVAELSLPSDRDVKFQRLVGRRSVGLGLPLEPLIASFQVGFRELWAMLARRASRSGDLATSLLLERGTIVWERLVATTTAVSEGYKEELARREAFEATTTARFIEALESGDDPGSRSLARELGFDYDGTFRALEIAGPVTIEETARSVVAKIVASGGIASMARSGSGAVVIAQRTGDVLMTGVVEGIGSNAEVGVGSDAPGLRGASRSLQEAHLARAVSSQLGRPGWFESDWLLSLAGVHADLLESLTAPGAAVAGDRPHLADAVRAFADTGFSVAESSARLSISPSSQRYRLSRWRALTGWDPSTFEGLARSLLAIDFARR